MYCNTKYKCRSILIVLWFWRHADLTHALTWISFHRCYRCGRLRWCGWPLCVSVYYPSAPPSHTLYTAKLSDFCFQNQLFSQYFPSWIWSCNPDLADQQPQCIQWQLSFLLGEEMFQLYPLGQIFHEQGLSVGTWFLVVLVLVLSFWLLDLWYYHQTDMQNVRNFTRAGFPFADFTRKCVNCANFTIATKQCKLSQLPKLGNLTQAG